MPLAWFQRSSGKKIALQSLYVSGTYIGVMLGRPSAADNAALLKAIPHNMARLFGPIPVYVIHPHLVPDSLLPAYIFAGEFIAYEPVHDLDKHASRLAIVWFQDHLEPVCSESTREEIAKVPWEQNAVDFIW